MVECAVTVWRRREYETLYTTFYRAEGLELLLGVCSVDSETK